MIEAIIVFLIIVVYYYLKNRAVNEIHKIKVPVMEKIIEEKTDEWIDAVTIKKDSQKIKDLFCKNATLLGTVSRVNREKENIRKYFDYFSGLPNIKVTEKEYDIKPISEKENIYMNNAKITWSWDNIEKLLAPTKVTARMSFVFNGNCIMLLHSSKLPSLNKDLYVVSGEY